MPIEIIYNIQIQCVYIYIYIKDHILYISNIRLLDIIYYILNILYHILYHMYYILGIVTRWNQDFSVDFVVWCLISTVVPLLVQQANAHKQPAISSSYSAVTQSKGIEHIHTSPAASSFIYISIYLSIHLPVYLSIYLSLSLSPACWAWLSSPSIPPITCTTCSVAGDGSHIHLHTGAR